MDHVFPVGTTVKARGGCWLVVAAEPLQSRGDLSMTRLRLRALDGPLRGEELPVLYPIEQVERDKIPELRLQRPGRLGRFRLLHEAFLFELAHSPDILVAASRSRVNLEPYQHVPVHRALAMPRPRLLIADDVGLGKTIEAGLILRELNARRRARRVLIVCPAHLMGMWQEEMLQKFGFTFVIFDRDGILAVKQRVEAGTNPWMVESRVIASMDFVKRREGPFREVAASRWDVVIVDEAHHLAAGRDEEDITDRHRLGRWLAEAADALFLLTGTPHDGYDETFASLLKLLEPRLVPPGEPLRYERYRPHLIRRLKRHILRPDGSPKFPPRLPPQPIPVRLQEPEQRLHEAVLAQAASLDLFADETAGRPDAEAIRLVATVLRKRAASSRESLALTLAERRENLEERAESIELQREHLRALRRGDTIPDPALRQLERDAHASYLSIIRRLGKQVRRIEDEQDALARLEALLAECAGIPESKMWALHGWLSRLHAEGPTAKVIVFSEYEDTVKAVAGFLEENGYAGKVVMLSGGLTPSRRERDQALAQFAGPQTLILVATDAAGEGLNLHKRCHHLVHFDLPWNPNRLEQRNGRIDRYGQSHSPVIAYLYGQNTYDGELLTRLVLKLEQQFSRLGSIGDVLGQLQADRIEALLRRAPADVRSAVEEAERQLEDELNRAAASPLTDRLGRGESDASEIQQVEAALRQGRGESPPLDVLLERAVRAANGTCERRDGRLLIITPAAWRSSLVQERYELYPPDQTTLENLATEAILSEDHPLFQAAIAWVRARRFDPQDDHRLAYQVVQDLDGPDLVATFLVTIRDGDGVEMQRLEAVRVVPDGEVRGTREEAVTALWAEGSGNVDIDLLITLFASWWERGCEAGEAEARRRATSWRRGILSLRQLGHQTLSAEQARWEKAAKDAALGDYKREYAQLGMFGQKEAVPRHIRRRLDEHERQARERLQALNRRLDLAEPTVDPLGVLLRIPVAVAGVPA